MISVLKVMTIDDLSERRNDLVVSVDDIKAIARNERLKTAKKCLNILMERFMEVGTDIVLYDKITQLVDLNEKEQTIDNKGK